MGIAARKARRAEAAQRRADKLFNGECQFGKDLRYHKVSNVWRTNRTIERRVQPRILRDRDVPDVSKAVRYEPPKPRNK